MSTWSILLRVFLIVALTFSGATTAMASMHLGHAGMHEVMAPPVVSAASQIKPACHEQAQDASAKSPELAAVTGEISSAQSEHAMPPDCCQSGVCRCICMQSSHAAIPVVAFMPVMIEHAASVRPMPLSHAAPALLHLIRPPIG